jgi:hypothetical protein
LVFGRLRARPIEDSANSWRWSEIYFVVDEARFKKKTFSSGHDEEDKIGFVEVKKKKDFTVIFIVFS